MINNKLTMSDVSTTKFLSQPFTDEKNQTVFLSLGLFWVTNIGELFDWSTLFSRLFFYPVYLILLLKGIYLTVVLDNFRGS